MRSLNNTVAVAIVAVLSIISPSYLLSYKFKFTGKTSILGAIKLLARFEKRLLCYSFNYIFLSIKIFCV